MLGILDRVYAYRKLRKKKGTQKTEPEVTKDDSENSWYCFIPRIVSERNSIRERILPKNGEIIKYTIDSSALIVPDPEETLHLLRIIYDDAVARMQDDARSGKTINILGISLGNVLAIKSASQLNRENLGTLVSLVGGGRLGLSAWDSVLTGPVVRRSGLNSGHEYEALVEEFSPIHYIGDLSPQSVFARFGKNDLLIPYNPHGIELRKSLEQMNSQKIDIKTYPCADHVSTLLFSRIPS